MLSLPPEYSLAYCIANDFYMSADILHSFKYDVIALLLNLKSRCQIFNFSEAIVVKWAF